MSSFKTVLGALALLILFSLIPGFSGIVIGLLVTGFALLTITFLLYKSYLIFSLFSDTWKVLEKEIQNRRWIYKDLPEGIEKYIELFRVSTVISYRIIRTQSNVENSSSTLDIQLDIQDQFREYRREKNEKFREKFETKGIQFNIHENNRIDKRDPSTELDDLAEQLAEISGIEKPNIDASSGEDIPPNDLTEYSISFSDGENYSLKLSKGDREGQLKLVRFFNKELGKRGIEKKICILKINRYSLLETRIASFTDEELEDLLEEFKKSSIYSVSADDKMSNGNEP
jgi:hypothetical protein